MHRTFQLIAVVAILAPRLLATASAAESASRAAADLSAVLKSGDVPGRLAAIDALGTGGRETAGAVPALLEQLGSESAEIRAHAAHALGRLGPAAQGAAEALAKLVGDRDKEVRREAVRALAQIRPPAEVVIPLFCRLLREAEPEVRLHAMEAMAREGQAVVPPLIEALGHEEACYWACLVLAEIGADAVAAVPVLARLARSDPRAEVRREAILTLAAIGPSAASAVPDLMALVAQDAVNGGPAIYALGSIGPNAKAAEITLKELAHKPDSPPLLQVMSLWSLAQMHPDDKRLMGQVLPRLFASLKSSEPGLRAAAVRALLDLDPDPEMVRPLVEQLLREGDPQLIDEIVNIVAGLGDAAVPQLIEALTYPEIRAKAAAVIAKIGPPAKATVPALITSLSDPIPRTRGETLFALASIGPEAKEAVPAVVRLLGDPEVEVRYAATFALGKVGPSAMPAVPELQRGLDSPDRFLAMASAWALACIDPENQQTATKSVAVLIEALKAADAMTRLHSAEALGCLGPLARPAATALRQSIQDENDHVREAAAQALKAIGT